MMALEKLRYVYAIIFLYVFFQNANCFAALIVHAGNDTTICSGEPVTLGATVIVSGGSGDYAYLWTPNLYLNNQFVDHPIATPINSTPNTITITYFLTVTDNTTSESGTDNITITILATPQLPLISQGPQPSPCPDSPVQLTALPFDNNIYAYQWYLNSSPVSGAIQGTYSAFQTGIYSVTIRYLTSSCIRQSSNSISLTFAAAPNTNYTIDPASKTKCTYNPPFFDISLTNTSTTQSTNTYYEISWGDNSPNFSSNINWTIAPHTYANPGMYVITYTVTGAAPENCITTKKDTVYWGSIPAGGVTSPPNTEGCVPYPLEILLTNNTSTNPAGTLYHVTVSDGWDTTLTQSGLPPINPPGNSPSFFHTISEVSCYQNDVSYTVQCKTYNLCGEKNTSFGDIYVESKPHANFTISPKSPVCQNTLVTFTDSSYAGTNIRYQNGVYICDSVHKRVWKVLPNSGWTLMTGQLGTYANPNGSNSITLKFTSTGSYLVGLIIQIEDNSCGNDSVFKPICVSPAVTPSFTYLQTDHCSPDTITLINQTVQVNDCEPANFWWEIIPVQIVCSPTPPIPQPSFINGTYSTSWNPVIKFPQSGTFTIKFTYKNACGTNLTTTQVQIKGPPTASIISTPPGCPPASYQSLKTDDGCLSTITSYFWSFPGGIPVSSTQQNPTVTYSNPGNFNISYTVTNECGSSTANQSFTLASPPLIITPLGNITVCAGDPVVFPSIQTNPGNATIHWVRTSGNIGLPQLSGSGNIPTFTATNTSTVPIISTFTITPSSGTCPGTDVTFSVTVNPRPVITASIPSQEICSNTPTTIVGFTSTLANTTINWSYTVNGSLSGLPPNNQSGSIPSFTPINNSSAAVTITFTIIPIKDGCTGPALTYTIVVSPKPVLTSVGNQSVCQGALYAAINFTSVPGGAIVNWVNSEPLIGLPASNSGNIGSFIAGPNTSGADYVGTITASPILNGCAGNPITFTLIDKYAPVVNNISDQNVCSGLSTIAVPLSSIPSGASFAWTVNVIGNVTPIPPSGGGVVIPSITPINSGATMGTITYTIHATGNTCTGPDSLFTIGVFPKPTVAQVTNLDKCPNVPVLISFNGTPTSSIIHWINSNPLIGLGASGTGNISFTTAINTSGIPIIGVIKAFPTLPNSCIGDTMTFSIKVNPGPIMTSSLPVQDLCSGQTSISIPLTSNTPGTDFSWTANSINVTGFTNTGSTASLPGETLFNNSAFADNVNYSIILEASGCSNSYNYSIEIHPNPVVFAGNDDTICYPFNPIILNGTPAGGTWSNSGVNLLGNIFNPPMSAATYSLKYTYVLPTTPFCLNADSLILTIKPYEEAVAGIQPDICQGSPPFQLNGSPSGGNWTGSSYIIPAWLFNPAVQGSYTLNYHIGDGNCFSSADLTFIVKPLPLVILPPDTGICSGQPTSLVTLNATLTGTTFSWTCSGDPGVSGFPLNGTGSIPAFTPVLNTGTLVPLHIIVTITPLADGCQGPTAQYTFTVSPKPWIESIQDLYYCPGEQVTINLNPLPSGSITNWSNSNTTIGLPASGTGNTLTFIAGTNNTGSNIFGLITAIPSKEGCMGESITFRIFIKPQPFLQNLPPYDTICSGQSNAMINLVSVPSINPINWSATYTGVVPGILNGSNIIPAQVLINNNLTTGQVTFSIPLNSQGCLFTGIYKIIVNPLPQLHFTVDNLNCKDSAIHFVNTSTGGTSWIWSFGDGTYSNIYNPTHVYPNTGSYQVTLNSANTYCSDSLVDTLFVIDKPVVDFYLTPESGCDSLFVEFFNQSAGDSTLYTWNFANGMISHLYSASGIWYHSQPNSDSIYKVYLLSKNLCGQDSLANTITVFPKPLANFYMLYDTNCSPVKVVLVDTTLGLADSIRYIFGDGTPNLDTIAINDTIIHFFTTGSEISTYQVSLVAYNECGSDTLTKEIVVHPNTVTADFEYLPHFGCEPLTVQFTNASHGCSHYSWLFGDGSFANNSVNTNHTFNNSTNDSVVYWTTLIGHNECSYDTAKYPIVVYPQPVINFTVTDSICAGDTVYFNLLSQNLSAVKWEFGDGDSSSLPNPSHLYDTSGTYTVILTGYSIEHNCAASFSRTIFIKFKPKASFITDFVDGCSPLNVNFQNTTTTIPNPPTYYSWNFGNGNTSTLSDPSMIFQNTDTCNNKTYTITLMAETNGCANSAQATVLVYPKPFSSFITSDSSFCFFNPPLTIYFHNQSICANGFSWDFGNGNISSLNEPINEYLIPDLYPVTLISSNQYSCKDSIVQNIEIFPNPFAGFQLYPTSGCRPVEVNFSLNTLNLTYYWSFGDSNHSTLPNPSHTYYDAGLYSIKLIVSGIGGCIDSIYLEDTVKVWPIPIADFSYSLPDIPPSGQVSFMNTSSVDANHFLWNFGDDMGSNEENPQHYYHNFTNSYDVSLYVQNEYGCPDSITKTIEFEYEALYIPNAFSPSDANTEINCFWPVGVGLKEFHIQIFDTWGNTLWESYALMNSRPSECWDGKMNGAVLPMDVYVWKASAIFRSGRIWQGMSDKNNVKKAYGTVTLIK